MSIGPMGALGASLAGTPLAQSTGPEADLAAAGAAAHARRIESHQRAETAAGVGQPDGEDHRAETDRQPDGRLPWQPPEEPLPDRPAQELSPPADPTGQRGTLLDTCG